MATVFHDLRLFPRLELVDDRRLLLLSGETNDLFFADDAHGSCRLTDALILWLKSRGYHLVQVLDRSNGVSFQEDPQKICERYMSSEERTDLEHLLKGESRDPKASGRKVTFGGSRRTQLAGGRTAEQRQEAASGTPASGTGSGAGQAGNPPQPNVDGATQNAEANLLGRYLDALNKSEEKMALIVQWPDTLALSQMTPPILEVYRRLACFAGPFGHTESRVIFVISNTERAEQFGNVLGNVANGPLSFCRHAISTPDSHTLERFLLRGFARHHLTCRNIHTLALTVESKKTTLKGFAHQIQRYCSGSPAREGGLLVLDGLYPEEERVPSQEEVFSELDALVGMKAIKEEFAKLRESILRSEGQPFANNYLLVGNPGQGKTVVARLLGKLLRALDVRKGKYVEMTVSDIASAYNSGDVTQKFNEKLREAAGGVLFIDEAYRFSETEWMRNAFSGLLTEMENHRESLTVILAGYEDTEKKLKKINPGFPSRINKTLNFEDYSTDELLEIFRRMWENPKIRERYSIQSVATDATEVAERYLHTVVLRRFVTNAREVRSLVEEFFRNAQGNGHVCVQYGDIPHPIQFEQEKAQRMLQEFDRDFLGMSRVKAALRRVYERAKDLNDKMASGQLDSGSMKDAFDPGGFLFLGGPGTGKTSVARRLPEFLRACGLLREGGSKFKEVDPARDLYGQNAKETGDKVEEIFQDARGGVLFIDEAYRLAQEGDVGRSVVSTIVSQMTRPEVKSSTAVILAGYESEMNDLFAVNPGLHSRFPNEVFFDNYGPDELAAIFHVYVKKLCNLAPAPEEAAGCEAALRSRFNRLRFAPDFANARTAESVAKKVGENQRARRLANPGDVADTWKECDLGTVQENGESVPRLFDELRGHPEEAPLLRLLERWERIAQEDDFAVRHLGEVPPARSYAVVLEGPGAARADTVRHTAEVIARYMETQGRVRASDARVRYIGSVSLKGSYLGQSKDAVAKAFRDASGRLLCIEAIDALVSDTHSGGDSYAEEVLEAMKMHHQGGADAFVPLVVTVGREDRLDAVFAQSPWLAAFDRLRLDVPPESLVGSIVLRRLTEEGVAIEASVEALLLRACDVHSETCGPDELYDRIRSLRIERARRLSENHELSDNDAIRKAFMTLTAEDCEKLAQPADWRAE